MSKAMSMHKKSENINDPWHLSAVLKMYDMLRLHDWEKFKSSSSSLAYEKGRSIIKVCSHPFSQFDSYQINMVQSV